jgi:hypothetical protein
MLSDDQYERIGPLLPGKSTDPGRTAVDNRCGTNTLNLTSSQRNRFTIAVGSSTYPVRIRCSTGTPC